MVPEGRPKIGELQQEVLRRTRRLSDEFKRDAVRLVVEKRVHV